MSPAGRTYVPFLCGDGAELVTRRQDQPESVARDTYAFGAATYERLSGGNGQRRFRSAAGAP